jgi:hypothetical protein
LRKLILAIAITFFALPSQASAATNSCPKWEPAIKAAGLPVKEFSYIAWRESRCRIKAINAIWKNGKIVWTLNKNGSYDSGLMQINSGHRELVKRVCGGNLPLLLTLDCNLAVAKHLYDAHGLSPWRYVKPHDSSQSSLHQEELTHKTTYPK